MRNVILARANDEALNDETIEEVFRFRHRIFHDRMGWDVASDKGREHDVYDRQNPVYVVARNSRRQVEGCWRVLPTTGPYMLRDVFPQLLHGKPAPCSPRVWELSRFAVSPSDDGARSSAEILGVTSSMLRAIFEFAIDNGIERYITVTSVSLERMMRRIGFTVHRFGPPVMIGKVRSVACWTDINAETREIVETCKHGSLAPDARDDQLQ